MTDLETIKAQRDALLSALDRLLAVLPKPGDRAYLVDSLDDPQLADDCTNHNAVVTPLYTLNGIRKP